LNLAIQLYPYCDGRLEAIVPARAFTNAEPIPGEDDEENGEYGNGDDKPGDPLRAWFTGCVNAYFVGRIGSLTNI